MPIITVDRVVEAKQCTSEFSYDGDRAQLVLRPQLRRPKKVTTPHIYEDITEAIGNTPLIRLTRFAKAMGLKCELLAKCEFLNPGGSIKDRIGLEMILQAEERSELGAGSILIEATSGNTGTGLALCAAVKGYPLVITLPQKMSDEKESMLRLLGAEVLRTPNVPSTSDESNIGLAYRLQQVTPNSIVLDQYKNEANPLAHYQGTAAEIIAQTEGSLSAIVIPVGTGGTITGIGQRLKEHIPDCKVIGVDPRGSVFAQPDALNALYVGQMYSVEGIGYDFIPNVLNRTLVDRWYKSTDHESYAMALKLAATEGMLVGGSSGAALSAAVDIAMTLEPGQRCVVILPDTARNYISKFVCPSWRFDRGFTDEIQLGRYNHCLASVKLSDIWLDSPVFINAEASLSDAMEALSAATQCKTIIVMTEERCVGALSARDIATAILKNNHTSESVVRDFMQRDFRRLQLTSTVGMAMTCLELHETAVVVDSSDSERVTGVLDHQTLVNVLLNGQNKFSL